MSELGPSPYTDPPLTGTSSGSPFGTSFTVPHPPPPSGRRSGAFELRPLSLGEILDRTFSLYRQRFWLYTGLSSVPAAMSTLSSFARLSLLNQAAKQNPRAQFVQAMITLAVFGVALVLYFLAYSVTQSATISAISSVYLGEETSIGKALRSVKRRWWRYILIVLWQALSAMWLPLVLVIPAAALMAIPFLRWVGGLLLFLVFASLIYSVIAYLRNSLGIAAATVEDLKVREAMRRSKVLVTGHKGRVFVIFLLLFALSMVGGVAVGICSEFMLLAHGGARVGLEAVSLLMTFVTNVLVAPVGAIALCLFYIDERVRKEGFDVELLMLRGAAPVSESLPSPFTSELTEPL